MVERAQDAENAVCGVTLRVGMRPEAVRQGHAPGLATLYPAIREVMEIAGSFELTATGSSMEPFLRGGRDRVELIAPNAQTLRRGDIALCQRDDGAFVLHRVCHADQKGEIALIGDAQFLSERFRRDQVRAIVKSCVRDGRRIDCTHGAWREWMTTRMQFRIRFPRVIRFSIRMLRFARNALANPAAATRTVRRHRARKS